MSVATLLVSPEDAQKLALASQAGRIQLLMKNPVDMNEDHIPAKRDLYGITAESERPVKVKIIPTKLPAPPEDSFIQLIRGTQQERVKIQQGLQRGASGGSEFNRSPFDQVAGGEDLIEGHRCCGAND